MGWYLSPFLSQYAFNLPIFGYKNGDTKGQSKMSRSLTITLVEGSKVGRVFGSLEASEFSSPSVSEEEELWVMY